jgi:hypothetical protein
MLRILRRCLVALVIGVSSVSALAAGAQAKSLPPIPACFSEGSGYGSCDGIAVPGGSAIVRMTAENKKTSFYLTGPSPLQSTTAAACGDAGCIYHHLDWVLGPGASVALGCQTNQSFCDVRVAPGSGWVPVYVRQDNDFATLYAIYNTGQKGDGTISGYVTDKTGAGVSGVTVDAYGEGDSHGQSGAAVSGDQGYYSMEVDKGTYKVIPSGGLSGKKKPTYKPQDNEVTVTADGRAKSDFELQGGLEVKLTLSSTSVVADGLTVVHGTIATTQYGKPKGGVEVNIEPKSDVTPTAAITSGALATLCDASNSARIWPGGTLSTPAGAAVKETTDAKTGIYKFTITVGTTPGPFSVEAIADDSSGVPLTKDIADVSDEATLNLTSPGGEKVGGFLTGLAFAARSGQYTSALASITGDPNTMAASLAKLSMKGGPLAGLAYSVVNSSASGLTLLVSDDSSPSRVSGTGRVIGSTATLALSPNEWAGTNLPTPVQATLAEYLQGGKLQSVPSFADWMNGNRAADNGGWLVVPNTASVATNGFEYLGWPYLAATGGGGCN